MDINSNDLYADLGVPPEVGERLAKIFPTMENLASTPPSTLHWLKDSRVSAEYILAYAQARVRGQRGKSLPSVYVLYPLLGCFPQSADRLVKIFTTFENLLETPEEELQTLMGCDKTRVELIRAYARLKLRGDHGTPLEEVRVLRGRLGISPEYAVKLVELFSTAENLAATSPADLLVLAGPTQLTAKILAYARLKILPSYGRTRLVPNILRGQLGLSDSLAINLVELFSTAENLAATHQTDLVALLGCSPALAGKIAEYAMVLIRREV